MMVARVAILFSGRGSNMIALLRAMESPDFGAVPAILITDNLRAEGVEHARVLGFECHVIDGTGDNFDAELDKVLQSARVDLVCLAGFMRILGAEFVRAWAGRILNIHPSLLPKYKGLNPHKRAIDAGDSHSGASVHLVNGEIDGGKVLRQVKVAIEPNDTEASLSARILHEEHRLYPLVLHDFLKGNLVTIND